MKLFHHTARMHLASIMREGLNKGDIVTAGMSQVGTNGVWLTTDPDPADHGLSSGEERDLSWEQRKLIAHASGRLLAEVPPTMRTLDKRAVRIEVVIPSHERGLYRWMKWAKKRCDPEVMQRLIETGGGQAKADTWWIYLGIIPPQRFRRISIRDASGVFVEAGSEQIATIEAPGLTSQGFSAVPRSPTR